MRIHVVLNADKWIVSASDSRLIAECDTKAVAVRKATAIAKEENARLYVHRADGAVEKVTDYKE